MYQEVALPSITRRLRRLGRRRRVEERLREMCQKNDLKAISGGVRDVVRYEFPAQVGSSGSTRRGEHDATDIIIMVFSKEIFCLPQVERPSLVPRTTL